MSETVQLVPELLEELPTAVQAVLSTAGLSPVLVVAAALPNQDDVDDQLRALVTQYLNAATAQATKRAYAADWRTFAGWCRHVGLSALPATPLTLAAYLAAAASTTRPPRQREKTRVDDDPPRWRYTASTLERHAAAIVAVHTVHGAPSPRDALVRQTLAGIRKSRRQPAARARPVQLRELRRMLEARPAPGWPGGPARRRDRCLLLFGFAGALRRSEAAAIDITHVDYHPEDGLHVLLPSSKTDQEGKGDVIALPFGSHPLTCPVCAYLAWMEVLDHHAAGGTSAVRTLLEHSAAGEAAAERKHRDHDQAAGWLATYALGPLFRPITRHGHLAERAMSGDSVHELVRRYAARVGLPASRISGHSLRAGFATTAARASASNREIMRQGRWTSHATVDGYVRLSDPLDNNAVTKIGL